MKKLFSIFAILAFLVAAPTVTVKAQTIPVTDMKKVWGATEATGATFDTVKTSTAVYLYSGPIWGFKDVVTVETTALELTGTTTGTAVLQYSLDGTNWGNYFTATDSSVVQTLADVTTGQSYVWKLANFGGGYLRVKYASAGGTVSVDIRSRYYGTTRRP